jgi:hypothetical protein
MAKDELPAVEHQATSILNAAGRQPMRDDVAINHGREGEF